MIANANIRHIIVLVSIVSDLKKYVNTENTNIPETNDKNLLGQSCPSNPLTAAPVASMKNQDTGNPNISIIYLYCLAQLHNIGPLN